VLCGAIILAVKMLNITSMKWAVCSIICDVMNLLVESYMLLTRPVSGWVLKLCILQFLSTFHALMHPSPLLSTCTLPHSLALCHTPSHSAVLPHTLPRASGPLSHTSPGVPLASPVHLVPLSFLVTTCTLVPGPLGHLVYKPCNYTLLPKKRNPVASPLAFQISQSSV
jgi:hypothetical protein